MLNEQAYDAAVALYTWYVKHQFDRGLPWRVPNEPLHRVAMVEGVLAQTRAGAVAAQYDALFNGVATAQEWMALFEDQRLERVAPLGLPRLKLAAVDSIARAIVANGPYDAASLERLPGVGPYTAGMVALLLGQEGVPVDTNIARVGARIARDGDPARWMADVIGAAFDLDRQRGRDLADPGPPFRAAYAAACAIIDVGARFCTVSPGAVSCPECPLEPLGQCRLLARHQLSLFRRSVVAQFTFQGLHCWPDAPAPTEFLRYPHRHLFTVEVGVGVVHGDREIEILALRELVRAAIRVRWGHDDHGPVDLGRTSCEEIAEHVLAAVGQQYGARPRWCRVLEDGENGAMGLSGEGTVCFS